MVYLRTKIPRRVDMLLIQNWTLMESGSRNSIVANTNTWVLNSWALVLELIQLSISQKCGGFDTTKIKREGEKALLSDNCSTDTLLLCFIYLFTFELLIWRQTFTTGCWNALFNFPNRMTQQHSSVLTNLIDGVQCPPSHRSAAWLD